MLKPKRKTTKEEIKKDSFVETVFNFRVLLKENSQILIRSVSVVGALIVIIILFSRINENNKNEAELLSGISISDRDSVTCAAEELLKFGVTNVAITLGSQGVFLANSDGKQLLKAASVSAIDTTAAGDCFNGAVAAKLSQGRSLIEGIRFGIQASSICVTRHGAQDAMPYTDEIEYTN